MSRHEPTEEEMETTFNLILDALALRDEGFQSTEEAFYEIVKFVAHALAGKREECNG